MDGGRGMRKPAHREKLAAALAALIKFYGRRDNAMVVEVLEAALIEARKKTDGKDERGKAETAIREYV
jgi:hypothetical protein